MAFAWEFTTASSAAVLLTVFDVVDDDEAAFVAELFAADFLFFFVVDLPDLRDDALPPVSTHITYNFDFIYLILFIQETHVTTQHKDRI